MASLRDTLANLVEQYKASDTPMANLMRGDTEGAKQAAANALQQATQDPYSGLNVLGTTKLVGKTAQELAHATAQKNAVEMLGLHPENTAMERAKALGFNVDEPVYHGTGANIKAFDPLLADTRRKTGTPTGSVVVTNNPEVANTYANQKNMLLNDAFSAKQLDYVEGGNVIPMYIQQNKSITFKPRQTMPGYDKYKPYWHDLYDPRYPEPQSTNDFAQLALEKGKESATIKNILDNAMPSTEKGNTTFVFNPKLLRSQFAAFDPKLTGAAAIAAGTASTDLLADEDKQKLIKALKQQ